MESPEALRTLAGVTESQWGMVTSAQAIALGVSHMNLTRLTEAGDLERLAHGVYKSAAVPGGENQDLVAAWLGAEPKRLAYQRLAEKPGSVVVSGESATKLHGIGDLRAIQHEFTTPTRKQTQRREVKYRTRVLPEQDVTLREGLPVTTRERTIADLIEDRLDLSMVADVLRDAVRQSRLDTPRLIELLSPLAGRNGYRNGDGGEFLDGLLRLGGIDLDALAGKLVRFSELSELILAKHMEQMAELDLPRFYENLSTVLSRVADAASRAVDRKQIAALAEVMKNIQIPDVTEAQTATALTNMAKAQERLADQLGAADWIALAEAAQSKKLEKSGS